MTEFDEANFLSDILASPNQLLVMGFIDNKLVSTSMVTASKIRRTWHCGEFSISVAREYWGRGIGGAMLDHVVSWEKDNTALTRLDFSARADNTRAILLYCSRGFVRQGLLRKRIKIDGQYKDWLAMGRDV